MKAKMFWSASDPDLVKYQLEKWIKGKKIKIIEIAQSINSNDPKWLPDVMLTIFYEERSTL